MRGLLMEEFFLWIVGDWGVTGGAKWGNLPRSGEHGCSWGRAS